MLINDAATRVQHEAVRNAAGWYCWTHFLLEVTGADATAFLEKIYSSPIAKIKAGGAKYTTMLNEDGIIIDDVIVYRMEEDKYWISTLHLKKLIAWLDAHKGESDVAYKDITTTTAMYAVQGPKSRELLNAFLAEKVDDQKFFTIRDNKFDDIPVKVSRSGYTGELGYEIYISPENAGLLEAKLAEHGKAFGAMQITEFQVMVWSLSTEKGYVLMSDLRGTNPLEVGLEGGIDWSKDFIGKEALEKIKATGPKRQLLGFIADDEKAHIEAMSRGSFGAVVMVNGEGAGRVTKYNYSYTLGKSIGFALVDKTKAQVSDRVTISGYGATLTGRIWYDAENKRLLGK
ncbi:MAG: aminomethyltransferase family protein [Anaerolineales bacterium]|nr:aminomethyltransferase family protein [Anaerolineales bacterium]